MLSPQSIVAAVALATLPLAQAWQRTEFPPCLQPFKPFLYTGCFSGTGLNFRAALDQSNGTTENCAAECKGNSFRFAGLSSSGACFCGGTINSSKVDESQCNLPEAKVLSIWHDPTFATGPVDPREYKGLGCYTDGIYDQRTLSHRVPIVAATPGNCLAACAKQGFPYAGTKYSNECWCGNNLAKSSSRVYNPRCYRPGLLYLYVAKSLVCREPCGYYPMQSSNVPALPSSSRPGQTSQPAETATKTSKPYVTSTPSKPSTLSKSSTLNDLSKGYYIPTPSVSSKPVTSETSKTSTVYNVPTPSTTFTTSQTFKSSTSESSKTPQPPTSKPGQTSTTSETSKGYYIPTCSEISKYITSEGSKTSMTLTSKPIESTTSSNISPPSETTKSSAFTPIVIFESFTSNAVISTTLSKTSKGYYIPTSGRSSNPSTTRSSTSKPSTSTLSNTSKGYYIPPTSETFKSSTSQTPTSKPSTSKSSTTTSSTTKPSTSTQSKTSKGYYIPTSSETSKTSTSQTPTSKSSTSKSSTSNPSMTKSSTTKPSSSTLSKTSKYYYIPTSNPYEPPELSQFTSSKGPETTSKPHLTSSILIPSTPTTRRTTTTSSYPHYGYYY